MTPAEHQRRIDHAFRVAEWAESNPFRSIAVARLESPGLAALGGPHAPAPTDTGSPVVEAKIAHAREVAEASAGEACPF